MNENETDGQHVALLTQALCRELIVREVEIVDIYHSGKYSSLQKALIIDKRTDLDR